MRIPTLALALSIPLALSSCVAVAGGVAAVVLSQEMLDNNTYVSNINQDVKAVWPTVKVFMADTSLEMIEIDEQARTVKAKIDGSNVIVGIEAYDMDLTKMRVSARRYGVNDGEMARIVMERLHRRIESAAGSY